MATCVKCGSELAPDGAFCPNCGTPASAPRADTLSGLETVVATGEQEPPTTVLQEGEVFHDRYTVKRCLGAGAMGIVYLADDKVTSRPVALKLVNPALIKSPTAVQRFLREGLTARDVRHANVIAMYDVGEDDDQLFLVMEYLQGENLRTWLHRALQTGEDVAFDTARNLIGNILEGLKAAHDTGVIHRDLKPENIMLLGDPAAGDYRLKILDFGIARAIDPGQATPLTTTGVATGTPMYMAPEQRTAADTVGPPADLYAVTAILYELLLGVPPEGRVGQPSKERDDLPEGIDAVVEKGLSSRPRSRYQSATEMLEALQGVDRPGEPAQAEKHHAHNGQGGVWDQTRDWFEAENRHAAERRARLKQFLFSLFGVSKPAKGGTEGTEVSGKKRYSWVKIVLWIFLFLGILSYLDDEYGLFDSSSNSYQYNTGGYSGSNWNPGSTPARPKPVAARPRATAAPFTGIWYDQLVGVNFAHAYVKLVQNGNSLTGTVYSMQGDRLGSLNGTVNGKTLSYTYQVINGLGGSGIGRIRPDGTHMDVRVSSAGITEQHILHKGHQPSS